MATLEKDKNSVFTLDVEQLRSELERVKAKVTELTNYKAEDGETWAQEKKAFLESKEFITF